MVEQGYADIQIYELTEDGEPSWDMIQIASTPEKLSVIISGNSVY